jgi:hypothetical protein
MKWRFHAPTTMPVRTAGVSMEHRHEKIYRILRNNSCSPG